jgi:hypothetical protein
MYRKPSNEAIAFAMECGWNKEEAERGYTIFDFDNTGMLELDRIDACYFDNDDVTEEDCVRHAVETGFCKIIPINELPKNMTYDGNDRHYYGWIDTIDNRRRINEFFN